MIYIKTQRFGLVSIDQSFVDRNLSPHFRDADHYIIRINVLLDLYDTADVTDVRQDLLAAHAPEGGLVLANMHDDKLMVLKRTAPNEHQLVWINTDARN